MADEAEKQPLTTTPADLAAGVDAVLARTFGLLNVADEARKLGLPEEMLRELEARLRELREIAERASRPPAGPREPEADGPG